MPRNARKNIASFYIHVIVQGIEKENIFLKEEYKKEYINLLQNKFQENFNIYLLNYCIMDNHAHLLIYTEKSEELSKAMSKVNTTYAIFYNKKEGRVGYVFRNRFYTQSIKDESHLYNAFVYIHRNPIKAGLVDEIEQYPYSSYQKYQRGEVDKFCVELLFHTQDYKKVFNLLHRNYQEKGDIFDIDKNKRDLNEIKKFLSNYCEELGIEKEEIKKSNTLILQIAKVLKEKYLCNNKEISEILKIGKNRITNIIKKKE
ncbi:MAG: hypothetical protein HFJ33_07005 [Clostridia bacterium]|nr:hypothetical protein [Clostridia bacterium]